MHRVTVMMTTEWRVVQPTLLVRVTILQVGQLKQTAMAGLMLGLTFNLDGDWLDDDEQIATNLEVLEGVNLISYSVPKDASIGPNLRGFGLVVWALPPQVPLRTVKLRITR